LQGSSRASARHIDKKIKETQRKEKKKKSRKKPLPEEKKKKKKKKKKTKITGAAGKSRALGSSRKPKRRATWCRRDCIFRLAAPGITRGIRDEHGGSQVQCCKLDFVFVFLFFFSSPYDNSSTQTRP
jgi:hypothetical protein